MRLQTEIFLLLEDSRDKLVVDESRLHIRIRSTSDLLKLQYFKEEPHILGVDALCQNVEHRLKPRVPLLHSNSTEVIS